MEWSLFRAASFTFRAFRFSSFLSMEGPTPFSLSEGPPSPVNQTSPSAAPAKLPQKSRRHSNIVEITDPSLSPSLAPSSPSLFTSASSAMTSLPSVIPTPSSIRSFPKAPPPPLPSHIDPNTSSLSDELSSMPRQPASSRASISSPTFEKILPNEIPLSPSLSSHRIASPRLVWSPPQRSLSPDLRGPSPPLLPSASLGEHRIVSAEDIRKKCYLGFDVNMDDLVYVDLGMLRICRHAKKSEC